MGTKAQIHSLDEAIAKVSSHCQSLLLIEFLSLKALGRVLREDVYATEDSLAFVKPPLIFGDAAKK